MSATNRLSEVDSCVYPPHKIAAIVQELGRLNVSADAVLAGTGLNRRNVEDPQTRTSTRQLIDVCENALRLAGGSREVAFRIGASLHVSSYTLYGYALLCTSNMRSACRIAAQYHRLANPLVGLVWRDDDNDGARWELSTTPPPYFPPMSTELYQFMLDMQFAVTATVHRDVFGNGCDPVRALVAQDRPAYGKLYRRYLNCPVEFGAGRNELHYPAAWLNKPPLFANPMTATIMTDVCDQLLSEMRISSGFIGAVYRELIRAPGQFPSAAAIADALHMTSRTLLRKLKVENTSYRQLLADARRMLAIDYLRNTQLGIEDIATALGFTSAAGFRHALKRWTGKNPSDFRPAIQQLDPFNAISRGFLGKGIKR